MPGTVVALSPGCLIGQQVVPSDAAASVTSLRVRSPAWIVRTGTTKRIPSAEATSSRPRFKPAGCGACAANQQGDVSCCRECFVTHVVLIYPEQPITPNARACLPAGERLCNFAAR